MSFEDFYPGEILAGKYRVERAIGIGGVGVVVAARHIELDEMVALKFLLPEMQARPDIVARFAQEAKAAVRIKSEYAARVFDVGVMPGRGPYLVMEYLDGKNLADLIEIGSLPLKRAVAFTLEVCEALAVAHSYGIIHRDIKPENLFISRRSDGTEVMKILDFGISKAALAGTGVGPPMVKTQDLMGTPLYMSPEQIRSTATVDQRSDIWSLGVVLYEMLTRQVPFPGDSVPTICAQVLETTPLPLRTFVAIPEAFQAVIDRCLEKDPARRFQNVAELAIALLPYGPIKSRVSAERTSSILEASGQSSGITFRFDSTAPSSTSDLPTISLTPTIPGAPIAPTFPSGTPNLFSAHPVSTLSSSPEAFDAFAKESRRTRMTIIAAAVTIIGVAGAAASFMIGAVRSKQEPVAAPMTTSTTTAAVVQAPLGNVAPTTPAASNEVGGNVTITLGASPVDARIYLDDTYVGSGAFKKLLPRDGRPHSVRAEAFGYVTRSVALAFDSDKEIVLSLERMGGGGGFARAAPPPRAPVVSTPITPPSVVQTSTPTAAPPASPPPAPAGKNIQEVDLPTTKKAVRPLDTSQPW